MKTKLLVTALLITFLSVANSQNADAQCRHRGWYRPHALVIMPRIVYPAPYYAYGGRVCGPRYYEGYGRPYEGYREGCRRGYWHHRDYDRGYRRW